MGWRERNSHGQTDRETDRQCVTPEKDGGLQQLLEDEEALSSFVEGGDSIDAIRG